MPLAPVLPAPATEPMPVECRTDAPHSCPSPPFSPPRGEVTPEFAVPPLAACPVCLQAPASQPQAEDAVFPCCAAFTHLSCLVQCALRHGSCPNCRAAVDHLPREPSISSRCRQLAIDLEPTVPPAHDTAVTAVRDYSTRTFREQTPLNRRTSVLSAAVASQEPPWILLSCRTLECIGRQCRSGDRTALALGSRCGFACAAKASSNLTALICPNRARLALSAMCRCSGRST